VLQHKALSVSTHAIAAFITPAHSLAGVDPAGVGCSYCISSRKMHRL